MIIVGSTISPRGNELHDLIAYIQVHGRNSAKPCWKAHEIPTCIGLWDYNKALLAGRRNSRMSLTLGSKKHRSSTRPCRFFIHENRASTSFELDSTQAVSQATGSERELEGPYRTHTKVPQPCKSTWRNPDLFIKREQGRSQDA